MDIFYAYTFGTAGYLTLQAVPMLLFPRLIIALLSSEVYDPTKLEFYLCRALALALFTLACLTIILTGSVPLSSSLNEGITTSPQDPKSPYAQPTLTITFFYHAFYGFYSYVMWTSTGVYSYLCGVVGSSILASVGLWCILFASSEGRISKKTGADKRTSGFPFKNVEADKRKVGKKS